MGKNIGDAFLIVWRPVTLADHTKIVFGLHFGWSVEGPVGSPTKIDCSYLSPEVKISDRLEAATKIYSSNILMSGQFYDLLSDHIKVGIRLIDHVTLKGGVKPF